jgi:Spy/CpxP family protein refolding chaperone
MNMFGRTLVLSSLALVTATAGAAHAWPGSSPATPAQQREGSAGGNDTSSNQGSTGPSSSGQQGDAEQQKMDRIVERALASVQLSSDQREAVDRIRGTLADREKVVRAARTDLMSSIAQQMSAGKVDRAALQQKIDAFVAAMKKASPGMRGALEELHGVLTPAQRSQLVDSIRQSIDEQKQQRGDGQHAMIEKMSKDLGLTRMQKREIKRAFDRLKPTFDDAHQALDKVLDAFRNDTLSLDQVVPQREMNARAVSFAQAVIDLADTATTVLTAEQRGRVSDELSKVASAGTDQQQGGAQQQHGGSQQGHVGSSGGTHGGRQGNVGSTTGSNANQGKGSIGSNAGSNANQGKGSVGSNAGSSANQGKGSIGSSAGKDANQGKGQRATGPDSGQATGSSQQPCHSVMREECVNDSSQQLTASPDEVDQQPGDEANPEDVEPTGEADGELGYWGGYGRRGFGRRGFGRRGYGYGYGAPGFDDVFLGGYGYSPYYSAYPGGYSYSYGVPFYGSYGYVW